MKKFRQVEWISYLKSDISPIVDVIAHQNLPDRTASHLTSRARQAHAKVEVAVLSRDNCPTIAIVFRVRKLQQLSIGTIYQDWNQCNLKHGTGFYDG